MNRYQDYETKNGYQDDLDADPDSSDPFMDEYGDDPTRTLGIPPEDFRNELDDLDIDDDLLQESAEAQEKLDDEREYVEDLDQDPDDEDHPLHMAA